MYPWSTASYLNENSWFIFVIIIPWSGIIVLPFSTIRYDVHVHREMTSDLRIIRNVKHTRASLIDRPMQTLRTSCVEMNYATYRNHQRIDGKISRWSTSRGIRMNPRERKSVLVTRYVIPSNSSSTSLDEGSREAESSIICKLWERSFCHPSYSFSGTLRSLHIFCGNALYRIKNMII